MKRFFKIFGITIASLIAIVIVAVCIAIYVVFTPSRITPIVNNIADNYIKTEYNIGNAELTFFSTFPELGLKVENLYILSPMQGAPSDTLVVAQKLIAKVDAKQFIKENTLDVHQVKLIGAKANIYINEEGENNFSVFNTTTDTLTEDTAQFNLPFDHLNIDELIVKADTLSYIDRTNNIEAALKNTTINATANELSDIKLLIETQGIDANINNTQYASNISAKINARHIDLQLSPLAITLKNTEVALSEFALSLNGLAQIEDDIKLDLNVALKEWDIPQLLKLIPESFLSFLDGIDINKANLSADANIKGIYNDSIMPIIDANIKLNDGELAYYEIFPHKIEQLYLQANAHIDLNDEQQSNAIIEKLSAKTLSNTLKVTGNITDIFNDLIADFKINIDANLSDFSNYVEGISGHANGDINAKYKLSTLQNLQLNKGTLNGNISLKDLTYNTDSMIIQSPKMLLNIKIPNNNSTTNSVKYACLNADFSALDFEITNSVQAHLNKGQLKAETNDIINNKTIIANLQLSDYNITAQLDSVDISGNINTYCNVAINNPNINAFIEYNTTNTSDLPTVKSEISFDKMQANYTDISANLNNSNLNVNISNDYFTKQPIMKCKITTNQLSAQMGEEIKVDTKLLSIEAAAQKDNTQENLLLQWNPELKVNLNDGVLKLQQFAELVEIPNIDFDYSNKYFTINKSNIILGNSDFSLNGEVHNIGQWLDKKDQLKGNLLFTSNHTDANELMALFSADSGSEENESEQTENTTDEQNNPFLVPKDVDLTFTTDIKEAVVFDQLARQLGGKLYIKDGILVLEEMGFICNAAKLQLTAMYKTPRRNHLFVGLDYHMLDVNIQELVNMIPQIDTMMPMLRSFRGGAELHLAAETYLNSQYEIKPSTTRGAVSITGNDLVLLDNETFGKIAKILMFSKKTENKVDSISVQATLFKKEIDIYPFCMSIDNYMAAVGGRHNLDMTFDYHISLLKPLYWGVDVNGTFDDLKIRPAKCRYAQDFRPIFHKDVETQNASLKKMINETLKRTVKTE